MHGSVIETDIMTGRVVGFISRFSRDDILLGRSVFICAVVARLDPVEFFFYG